MVREIGTFQKIINIIKYFIIMNVLYIIPITMFKADIDINFLLLLLLIYVVVLLIGIYYSYTDFLNIFNLDFKNITLKDLLIDIFLGVLMIGISYFWINIIVPVFQINVSEKILKPSEFVFSQRPWPCIASYLIMMGINAPVIEEIIFRGFLFNYFFDRQHYIKGAFVTSLLFASIHSYASVPELLFQFIITLPLFIAYYRNMNINDSILVHSINNIIIISSVLL